MTYVERCDRRAPILLLCLLGNVVLVLLAGCALSTDRRPAQNTPPAGAPTASPSQPQVTIRLARPGDRFHQLQEIPFLLTNHGDQTVFYRYGCGPPQLQQRVEGRVQAVHPTLSEFDPPVHRLEPGFTQSCKWIGGIWDGARNRRAEPGEYRFIFTFWPDEEAALGGQPGRQATGDWFTYVDPALWHATDAPTTPPPEPPTPATTSEDGVTIQTGSDAYAMRQGIPFTITNHLPVTITWQVKGCAAVQWIGQDEAAYLVRDITEEMPPELSLAPGESMYCGEWDQVAYYAATATGARRFRDYTVNYQVPPGWYRLQIRYRPQDEEERLASSPLFAITRDEYRARPAEAQPGLTVEPLKADFLPGEPVTYTIRNDAAVAAAYDAGSCRAPSVARLVGQHWLGIAAAPAEDPRGPLLALESGASQTCIWDQQAWQNPALDGRERWLQTEERAPVPPGRYRLNLHFWLPAAAADQGSNPRIAHSQLFTIAPPGGIPPRPTSVPEVTIAVDRGEYERDELVTFTITNHMADHVAYSYGGCDYPRILRHEEGQTILIFTENVNPPNPYNVLLPGESFTCTWQKLARQDPLKEGEERYSGEGQLIAAPPGYYEITFSYRHSGDPNRWYHASSPRFRLLP